MTKTILEQIKQGAQLGTPLLAILIDPDKLSLPELPDVCKRIQDIHADFVFVGGSEVSSGETEAIVQGIKSYLTLPIVIFPGDHSQITKEADALLFLSLLSGRNPEYLIEQQIKAVPYLLKTSLEIIPTGYILIDGGGQSSVVRVSKTIPIPQNEINLAVDTAVAGMFKGKQLIYLEAGSGATNPVNPEIIKQVKAQLNIPLIVGGGIRNREQLNNAYHCGADLVVIGTAFENNTFSK